MLKIFSYAFNAIAPIMILCFMGYILKSRRVFQLSFFNTVNRFVFHYCFPALMFMNLYSLDSIRELDVRLAVFLVGSIAVLNIVGLIIANLITKERNRKGVITQAGFRSNFALIGLPLTSGLTGDTGLALASSMQAPIIIYYNFFSVLFLSIYSDKPSISLKGTAKNIMKNPLIQGLAAGTVALLLRECIPVGADGQLVFTLKGSMPWLYSALSYISRMATPLALFSLGGQFDLNRANTVKKELIVSVFMRLVLAPIIGFTLAFTVAGTGFITLTPGVIATMIACFGSPLAVSAVPMAAEMLADSDLAGQIVVWTSLLSMVSIFLLAVIFRASGML